MFSRQHNVNKQLATASTWTNSFKRHEAQSYTDKLQTLCFPHNTANCGTSIKPGHELTHSYKYETGGKKKTVYSYKPSQDGHVHTYVCLCPSSSSYGWRFRLPWMVCFPPQLRLDNPRPEKLRGGGKIPARSARTYWKSRVFVGTQRKSLKLTESILRYRVIRSKIHAVYSARKLE